MISGAGFSGDGKCTFTVWAPHRKRVQVCLQAPHARRVDLERIEGGYWQAGVADVEAGADYTILLDEQVERPDPVSHFQPEGVHGPSRIIDHSDYTWDDSIWLGIPLEKMVIYEVHIGTFTTAGTFEAAIERLDELARLGVNAIEIMPVAQFPGERNWGYDGVYPYAVQNS